MTALDLDELAGLESIGDRPIDRVDGVLGVRAKVHADVIGVERLGETLAVAASGVILDGADDACAVLVSLLLAHRLLDGDEHR